MSNVSATEARARALLQKLPDVSRETLALLERYAADLAIWQARINLVAPGTMAGLWERHILDCAQIAQHGGQACVWADLGSGAGLPGLVLACLFKAEKHGRQIHLIESNRKKAAFLQHVTGQLDLPAHVHPLRIEDALPKLSGVEIVTARALAPLTELIGLSNQLLKSGSTGLFPKGRDARNELTEAAKSWHFSSTLIPSLTDHSASIVRIEMLEAGR